MSLSPLSSRECGNAPYFSNLHLRWQLRVAAAQSYKPDLLLRFRVISNLSCIEGLPLPQGRGDKCLGNIRPCLDFLWGPHHHIFGWKKANERP
jgi:hypothetical protein